MKKILFILLIINFAGILFAFDVANKGKSDCIVVIDKNPSPSDRYAAEEFVKYINLSSGVNLEITDTPKEKNNIFISTRDDVKSDWDTINLFVKNGSLYLRGDNKKGTIYSVYEFLEKYAGVKFFTDDKEFVKKKKRIFCPDNLAYRYKPSFLLRDTSAPAIGNSAFGVKCRLNANHATNDPKFGGRLIISGCHTFNDYIPVEKYGKDHPEFYAMQGGIRLNVKENQPCLSCEGMREVLIENVTKEIEKRDEKVLIDISQNDNVITCECDRCREKLKKYGSYSGILIECLNYVSDELRKKYPDLLIETLAYYDTRQAPENIVPRDNIFVRVCSIECNVAEPMEYADRYAPYKKLNCNAFGKDYNKANYEFDKDLREWSKICKNILVWEYTVNYHNYFMPHPTFQVIKPNLNYYKRNNTVGVYEASNPQNRNSSFDELKTYVMSKLMWDVSLDEKALIKEFCDGVYGAGSRDIQKCIDIFTDIFLRDHYYLSTYSEDMAWMSDSEIIQSVNLYKDALKKTENDPYANDRIQTLYMSFLAGWYTLNNERFEYIRKKCSLPWNTKADFFKDFKEYNLKHKNPNYKETYPFNIADKAVVYDKYGETPKVCKDLKDTEYHSINALAMKPMVKYDATYGDDETSSSGKVLLLKNNDEWGCHIDFSGNVAKDFEEGYRGYDVYAICKSVGKKGNEGSAFEIGVYDYDKSEYTFSVKKSLSEIVDNWTEVYFGHISFDEPHEIHPYFVGCKNDKSEYISVDRIILIKK